jgi:hypothetical protein
VGVPQLLILLTTGYDNPLAKDAAVVFDPGKVCPQIFGASS